MMSQGNLIAQTHALFRISPPKAASKPLMTFEDLNGIIATREVDPGRILNSDDALTFGQYLKSEMLGNDDHAIKITEDEISGVDDHRFGQFPGHKNGDLMVEEDTAAEGLDRAAIPGEDRKVHRHQHPTVAGAAIN